MTMPQPHDIRDIRDEQLRMTRLRLRVDLTSYQLRYGSLSLQTAHELIERTRAEILELFPDKGEVFDLVLRPRFQRIITERALGDWDLLDSMN
jgi:predicted HTH domain antitoxin